MAKGFKHGATGTALNFKVVGNPQPVNPKENTIWIDTDTPITSYEFRATEPSAPLEGMVWIDIGTTSHVEFNALKKNGIRVYPLSAKQYIGGAWVDKVAKSGQNGEWVDWYTIIPMTADVWKPTAIGSGNIAVIGTFSDGVYSVTTDKGYQKSTAIGTIEKIHIDSETKKIIAHVVVSKASSDYGAFKFFLSSNYYYEKAVAVTDIRTALNGDVELNVENVTGDFYLVLGTTYWNNVDNANNVACQYSNIRIVN